LPSAFGTGGRKGGKKVRREVAGGEGKKKAGTYRREFRVHGVEADVGFGWGYRWMPCLFILYDRAGVARH